MLILLSFLLSVSYAQTMTSLFFDNSNGARIIDMGSINQTTYPGPHNTTYNISCGNHLSSDILNSARWIFNDSAPLPSNVKIQENKSIILSNINESNSGTYDCCVLSSPSEENYTCYRKTIIIDIISNSTFYLNAYNQPQSTIYAGASYYLNIFVRRSNPIKGIVCQLNNYSLPLNSFTQNVNSPNPDFQDMYIGMATKENEGFYLCTGSENTSWRSWQFQLKVADYVLVEEKNCSGFQRIDLMLCTFLFAMLFIIKVI